MTWLAPAVLLVAVTFLTLLAFTGKDRPWR